MKVFLDDMRRTPPGWRRAYTAEEAILFCREGNVKELSLDYDLDEHRQGRGYAEPHPGTGGDVSKWLLGEAMRDNWDWVPSVIRIHSSNWDGVCEMAWDLAEIERLRWAKALGLAPEAAL